MTELNRQILAKEQQIRDLNQRLADASDLYKVLLRHSKQTQDTKKRIKNIEARITELQDRLNRLVDEEFVLLGQLGTVEIFLLQQKTVAERIRKCMN